MPANESTRLLPNAETNGSPGGNAPSPGGKRRPGLWERIATVEMRLLFAGFLITTSLCFTQVPILYAFRQMECDKFYAHAPPYEGTGDRCKNTEIDAGVTLEWMVMGLTNIVCGIFNLILTGRQIRRWGPRASLMINIFFPVLRVIMQSVAVGVGSGTGIFLMQASQLISIIGGPAGSPLVLNTALAEVVDPAHRTGSFGKLQGGSFFGTALGFLLGGIVGESTTVRRPFDITAVLLSLCFIFCFFLIPYIDPKSFGGADKKSSSSQKKPGSLWAVLGPKKLRLEDGRIIKSWGITILTLGVFIAGLAVGYAPILIQMFSITVLDFSPIANSGFMFLNGSIRGLFLIFAFPRIIAWGRKRLAPVKNAPQPLPAQGEMLPAESHDIGPILENAVASEPVNLPQPVEVDAGAAFDLLFLRCSMIGDAFITGCVGFASQPWHIFLTGSLLPLFSGSDAAGKGVLTDMVSASERPDALQAMTIVQYLAALSTVGIFGAVYAAFARIGAPHLTFFCNAAVALLSIAILCFCHLPPKGSTPVDEEDDADHD